MSDEILASQLAERIARLKELRESLSKEIDELEDVRDLVIRGGIHRPPLSHFMKIAKFLLSEDNRPRTAKAILKGTNLTRGALSQVLHRTHRNHFVSSSIPGFARKKKWSLTEEAATQAARELQHEQPTLFGAEGDLSRLKAVDCCARILRDHGNKPMPVYTMVREAIGRGYRGRVRGSDDEVISVMQKSFWAALSRDSRFREIRSMVYQLVESEVEENGPDGAGNTAGPD
jgi:hypothetical protein